MKKTKKKNKPTKEGKLTYVGLQAYWRLELQSSNPDWLTLESISRQLRSFEQEAPKVGKL